MSLLNRAALALALLTLACLPAAAADARGKISQINPANYQLVLEGGQAFAIPEEFYVEDLEPGMTVVIEYEVVDGAKVIYDLEVAE